MSRIETTTRELFTFGELSDKAKETARDWWRECEQAEFGAHGDLMESAETAAKLLGITFAVRDVPLMSGKTRTESDIRWSGFSSQGDGASFVGSYAYVKGSSKAVRAEFPTDTTLHAIADGLTAIQRAHGYKIVVDVTQGGRYVHKYTMDCDIFTPVRDTIYTDADGLYKPLLELFHDFAQWIYDGLRAEYDYHMSDENVDDAILANEYEFTQAAGQRA